MASSNRQNSQNIYENDIQDFDYRIRRQYVEENDAEDSEEDRQSGFDPPWVDAVNQQGELFYVEPPQSDTALQQNGTTNHHASTISSANHISPNDDHDIQTNDHKKKAKKKKKDTQKSKITNLELNTNNLNSHTHGVTFNDVPTGVMKEVTLSVDPHRHNYGRRATLCETLFGIIPGGFSSRSQEMSGASSDRRIMVQGLIPGGESMRAGVKIGEWLMMVNDLEVNSDNIDNILSDITGPRQVVLTLQKIAIQTSPKPKLVKKSKTLHGDLVKLVSGERLKLTDASLDSLPHCVMYLTMEGVTEESNAKDDVVYQYPRDDSGLVQVRGIFNTLCHVLLDVTHNTAKSTTLQNGGKFVHVGYHKENREVFLFCVPANRMSLVKLHHIVDEMVRLLKVLYGSMHSAFKSSQNHCRLDHFFRLQLLRHLLSEQMIIQNSPSTAFLEPFLDVVPAARVLALPEEVKITVNNCLSEFEAAEFADMSDDFYDLRRLYTIQGSCIFYKGYLLSNHLHREDLRDIHSYLCHYCLLSLCNDEQLGQVVLWKEIFPTRRCHKQCDPLIPGFTEPEARCFLLIVGLKNMLLGVILEAGGCATWAEGMPGPDVFYVEQAKATILQMESLDVITHCEIRLQSAAVPSLSCIDWFLPSTRSGKEGDQSQPQVKVQGSPIQGHHLKKSNYQPESILKKRVPQSPNMGYPRQGRGPVYEFESDIDSLSTGTSEGSTPMLTRKTSGSEGSGESGSSSGIFKKTRQRRSLVAAYDMSGLRRALDDSGLPVEEGGSYVKLTSGCDNTLFHFINMDTAEGVLICPTQQELSQQMTHLHSLVLRNFHECCANIRKVLEHSVQVKKWDELNKCGQFGMDGSLGDVVEHGVLFQCTPLIWTDAKKQPPSTAYWVVGRMLPGPNTREFYVCFQDSATQNAVEMAFKLGFGILA